MHSVSPGIAEAYRSGAAGAFFPQHYADAAARLRAVLRAERPLTPAVADALAAQNARLHPSPRRDAHLAALRRGAAAVVTGQQVGLFLGPLFTLYKTATAVRAARELAAETGRPVVPVFWLQSEDHDLPEIATCHLPSAHGQPLALRLPASPDDRTSLAHCILPDGVATCHESLRAALAHLPHAEEHLARLARHYRPKTSWTAAFAGFLAELFAPEGLVLIDPRDPALARLAAAIHRRALVEAEPIAAALLERGRTLSAAGFAPTVHVRAGAPLSFFHPRGAAGPRYRLEPSAGGFTEVGGTDIHSLAALLAAVDAEPLRFSNSALLRPIVQDTLLPTAAYVAGPGEVAYFAQLAPLYAAFGLEMPLVLPRAGFRILEDKTLRLLARLGLAPDDAERAEDEILATTPGADAARLDCAALASTLLAPFDAALDRVRARLEDSGPGLPAAVAKTRATVAMAVAKLAGKYEKALLHRSQAVVDDVRYLKQRLYPNAMPQERFYGLSYFAARFGERALIERVLEAVAPFDPAMRDLAWPEGGAAAVETSR